MIPPKIYVKYYAQIKKKGIAINSKTDMDWRIKTFVTNKLPPDKPLRIIDFIFKCFEDQNLKYY